MNGTMDVILVKKCNQTDGFRTVLPAKLCVRVLMIMMLAAAAVLVAGAGVGAAEKTWYVDDGGGEGVNFTKIQDAVDAAGDGDTIYVHVGTYVENVDIDTRINLSGIGMPVVDANGSGDVIRIAADGCIVEGFKITNSDWASGIKVESDGNIIKNNIVSGNCYAIHLLDSSNNEITENKVSNNDFGIHISTTEISTTIGAEGGIIEVTNPNSHLNGIKVEIPAGALDDATDIKLRPISQEELEKEMKVCYTGSAYDFLKAIHLDAGGATFKKPINITIPKPLNVSENGSILVAQIFPDVDNNTKPDLILVDIGSVEGEVVVGSSSVEGGLTQASFLPVPGITQGGTLAFLYQGETIFLTGRVVDSMSSPLGGSIVTSLQSGGIKAISQTNGMYALNVHFFGSGEQKIVAVGYAPNLHLYAIQPLTMSVPLPPPGVVFPCPDMTIDLLKDEAEEKLKTESEALPKTSVCDDIRYLSFVMGVVNKAADELKYVGNIFEDSLKASKIPFNPDEVNIHPGEEVTLEGDFSSILGVKKPVEYSVVKTMPPIVGAIPENENLQIKICGCELSIIGIGSSVKDESVATIVDTEDPTKEDPTYKVTVKGGYEGTTEITGNVAKLGVSFDVNFGRVIVDVDECEMRFIPEWGLERKLDPSIDILGPATINVGCFPDDHFNDTEYEDSNQDWDGNGELDGTDKNGDTYGDKQITWHAERTHVVCEDFSINSEGYTLTIEPGAEVTFVTGATLEAEDDGGVLIAEGTEDQRIVFREFGGGNCSPSHYSPPSLWIKSDDSRFSYCSVERGVELHLSYADLEISHCDFSHPDIAIECGSPTITENTFCDGGWVDIHDDDAQVTGNTFEGSDIVMRPGVDSPSIARNNFNGSDVGAAGSSTITENSFTGSSISVWSGSPTITENSFTGSCIGAWGSSPTITENSFTGGCISGYGESYSTITGNTISGGCISGDGGSSIITGNSISGSRYSGICMWDGSQTITENSISGSGSNGIIVDGDSIVTGNSISGSGSNGITAYGDSIVTGNSILCSGSNGIIVYGGSVYGGSPTITGNNITGNGDAGIDVKCGSPTITGNTILGNGWCGIYAPDASPSVAENDICGNGEDCSTCGGEDQDPCECWECLHGMTSEADAGYAKTANVDRKFISVVNDPTSNAEIRVEDILETGVTRNSGCISSMSSSSNNIIYLNTFINNGCNAVSSESANIWNSTEKVTYIHNGSTYLNYTGNYWDDYAGDDLNGDGIGDDPHLIPGGESEDCYPLIAPWHKPYAPGDLNGDNQITPADAAIALQIAATGAHDDAADVSGDGQVTSLDALMILQAAAGGGSL